MHQLRRQTAFGATLTNPLLATVHVSHYVEDNQQLTTEVVFTLLEVLWAAGAPVTFNVRPLTFIVAPATLNVDIRYTGK